MASSRNLLVKDRYDQPVFLFENKFAMNWFHDKYPDVVLEEKNVIPKTIAVKTCDCFFIFNPIVSVYIVW